MRKYILISLVSTLLTISVYSQSTEVIFLQINDVYEIAPIQGGMFGGLARVSSIEKQLMQESPNTYFFLSGDFISPSALSTAKIDGEKINGAQMVDVLNFIGLDFCTFGNHEFDYDKTILQKRMDESRFAWISGNVKTQKGDALWKFGKNVNGEFRGLPEYTILKINTAGDRQIRIGVLGISIDANKAPYVVYEDYYASAKRVFNLIKDSIDCLTAMTHLEIGQDRKLAGELPELSLIMGGHEHQNNLEHVGNTEIAKADANAKTVYVHRLMFNDAGKLESIKSQLVSIDGTVAEDQDAKQLVDSWVKKAFDGFRKNGFEPERTVSIFSEPYDGRDEYIRTQQTNLGNLIASAMQWASTGTIAAVFNGGSVRLDDELNGEVSQYDIIRTLPFGGKIIEVELKGSLLEKLLTIGKSNAGSGGYLQYSSIKYNMNDDSWSIGSEGRVDLNKTYNIAIAAYLLTGMEQNMGFFTKDNPDILKITEPDANNPNDLRNDVRLALIKYLETFRK